MAKRTLTVIALFATLSGCVSMADAPTETVGSSELRFANGLPAGNAKLLRGPEQLSLTISVAGLEPGPHGFHLHTVGRCEAPNFTSAGGHLNPYNRDHGTLSDGGSHLGDLPNLTISSSGSGTAEVVIGGRRDVVLDEIFDDDGTAIIIHENADDYRTDPSGNAGPRIACGVLREG